MAVARPTGSGRRSEKKTTLPVPATSSQMPNDSGRKSGCHAVSRKKSANETSPKKETVSRASTTMMSAVVARETAAQAPSTALTTASFACRRGRLRRAAPSSAPVSSRAGVAIGSPTQPACRLACHLQCRALRQERFDLRLHVGKQVFRYVDIAHLGHEGFGVVQVELHEAKDLGLLPEELLASVNEQRPAQRLIVA